jgi:hypothetical protein
MPKLHIDNLVRDVAETFKCEARKIHTNMDWPHWRTVKISLEVTFCPDDSKFHLEYSADGTYIKASTLDALVREVSRRLNFEDQESAKIETSMKALPAPDEDDLMIDDSVPF